MSSVAAARTDRKAAGKLAHRHSAVMSEVDDGPHLPARERRRGGQPVMVVRDGLIEGHGQVGQHAHEFHDAVVRAFLVLQWVCHEVTLLRIPKRHATVVTCTGQVAARHAHDADRVGAAEV